MCWEWNVNKSVQCTYYSCKYLERYIENDQQITEQNDEMSSADLKFKVFLFIHNENLEKISKHKSFAGIWSLNQNVGQNVDQIKSTKSLGYTNVQNVNRSSGFWYISVGTKWQSAQKTDWHDHRLKIKLVYEQLSSGVQMCHFHWEPMTHVSPWQRSDAFHNSLTSLPPLPKPEVKGQRDEDAHANTHVNPCNLSPCFTVSSTVRRESEQLGTAWLPFPLLDFISWCSIKGICSIGLYVIIQIIKPCFPANKWDRLCTLWLDTFQALLMRIDVYGNKPRNTNQPLMLFNVQ